MKITVEYKFHWVPDDEILDLVHNQVEKTNPVCDKMIFLRAALALSTYVCMY